jgi:hypothetical protein
MDDGDGPVESEEEGDDHQVHGHGHEHAHNILAVHHQTAVDAVDHLTSNHGGSAGVHEHQHQHGVAHEMNEHENLQGEVGVESEQVQMVGHHAEVPTHEEDGDENYYKDGEESQIPL